MITENSDKAEILNALTLSVASIASLATALSESQFNQVPYEGSWTPAQLLDHVTKSILGMAGAIKQKGKPAERGIGEKIAELKKTFLDLTLKMQSPDFIIPGNGPFKKEETIKALNTSLDQVKENSNDIDLSELLEGLPFGPVTKLELLHFTYYHTTRHSFQMKKICDALK